MVTPTRTNVVSDGFIFIEHTSADAVNTIDIINVGGSTGRILSTNTNAMLIAQRGGDNHGRISPLQSKV